MKKWIGWAFLFLALISAVLAFLSWNFLIRPASQESRVVTIDIPPGSNFSSLVPKLAQEGIRIPILPMKIWVQMTGAARRLRFGEYQIKSSDSPYVILKTLIYGPAKGHQILVREGANIWDVQKSFEESVLKVDEKTFMSIITDPKRLERMGVPTFEDPTIRRTLEGFLFPETYTFFKYNSPESVVDHMLDLFEERVKGVLAQHPWGNTSIGRYKLLILASIVEKESGDVAEQPIIASVYWNRIRKGMKLQADPTTIYGLMPNFNGNLTKANLLEKTPYNTYRITGLPPTPIANPGESAIRATVNPASTEYLFFVSRNDGTHVFSKDYVTHNKHVNEFQRSRSKRSTSTQVGKDR